jgi:hypothetical protein
MLDNHWSLNCEQFAPSETKPFQEVRVKQRHRGPRSLQGPGQERRIWVKVLDREHAGGKLDDLMAEVCLQGSEP